MLSVSHDDRPEGPAARPRLLQRQDNNQWVPFIFRYVFPKNAFQRHDQWSPSSQYFSFPSYPLANPDCLTGAGREQYTTFPTDDNMDMIIPSDITDILNSIVIPDEFTMSLPPPPLELDATRAIPELDLSNDYLQSLNSDYLESHGHYRYGI